MHRGRISPGYGVGSAVGAQLATQERPVGIEPRRWFCDVLVHRILDYGTPMNTTIEGLSVVTVVLAGSTGLAQPPYSPPVSIDHPTEVFWGDTHLHTQISGDAYIFGTRLGHEEAYRFAKGEEVTSSSGQPVKMDRPLDFLVIADHANNLGAPFSRGSYAADPSFKDSALGKLWEEAKAYTLRDETVDLEKFEGDRLYTAHQEGLVSVRHDGFRRTFWEMATAAADRHNDPGRFTAFIGYEWTPSRDWGSVHRVVVFRDDATRANQILPFSSYDSGYAEDLWEFLESYQRDTGGRVFAIPHNSNLTSGMMFDLFNKAGEALDAGYNRTRARWEPLLEVTQIKGDSETHPYLSPNDEFADFETWNGWAGVAPNPDRPEDKIQFEYARSALKLGLDQQHRTGANPFKFGLIGSTDSHTALASAAENNFWGKFGANEPAPDRMQGRWGWQTSAAGYAAVWATENTRAAIFDAMRRRETYASTGPRMRLRFFGGWDFADSEVARPDRDTIGYRKGVPMGGDLTQAPVDRAPTFMVYATKDPAGANLDRAQIVKGWRTGDGALMERVFDVVWSGERRPGGDGRLPTVGSTVDVEAASYTNTIGAVELATVWRDPEFNAREPAFYYARVLEIPTPRWTAYEAKYYALEEDPEIPMVLQERAYSSPIWYSPSSDGPR